MAVQSGMEFREPRAAGADRARGHAASAWLVPAAVLLAPLAFALSTHVWLGSGSARSALMLAVCAASGGVLLFAPGVAALRLVERRFDVGGPAARLCVSVVAGGALYWLVWWVWVLAPPVGRVLALALWAAVVIGSRPVGKGRSVGTRSLWLALGLSVAMAVSMIAVITVHGGVAVAPDITAGATFGTADNMIQLQWVERVEERADLREPALGWPLVERPPGQAAWIAPAVSIAANKAFAYEVLSAVLQALAATAVATAVLTMGVRGWRAVAALGLVTLTVFMSFNTVFVWPKLMPGALLVLAVAALLDDGSELSVVGWAGVAGAVMLSAMAHPGALFAVPALLVVMARQRSWPRTRQALAASVGAAALVALPWIAYQLFFDRSTSLLLKWHLAGIDDPADRRGLGRAVLDQYRAAGVGGWLRHRWDNLGVLAGGYLWTTGGWSRAAVRQRWIVLGVIGPIWSGGLLILTVPLAVLRRRYSREVATTLLAATCAIVVYVVVEFGPPVASTTTNNAPYADLLLLSSGLAALAALVLHRWLLVAFVAVQGAFALWVVYPVGAADYCGVTQMCMGRDYVFVRSKANVYGWIAVIGVVALLLCVALARTYGREWVAERERRGATSSGDDS